MGVQMSKRAIELRKLGYSYTDIIKELKVSRASVSNWVKNIRLTENEKINLDKNLKNKIKRGRMNSSIAVRSKKIFKEKIAYDNALKEYEKFSKEPFFMLGLGLYLAHGLKRGNSLQFTNQNPFILRIILQWMKKYLNLSKNTIKYRLFINISHRNGNYEDIWSKNMDIPLNLFQKTMYLKSIKSIKDREYKGSLTITVSRIDLFRKVIAWQKILMGYYAS